MSNLPEINTQFLLDFLTSLLNTPSPTGLAEPAIALIEQTLKTVSRPQAFPHAQGRAACHLGWGTG